MTKEEIQQRYHDQSTAAKARLRELLERRAEELHQAKEAAAQQQEEATRTYFREKRALQAQMRMQKDILADVSKKPNSDAVCNHWRKTIQQTQDSIDQLKTDYQEKMRAIGAETKRRVADIRFAYEQELEDQRALLHSLRTAYFTRLAEVSL